VTASAAQKKRGIKRITSDRRACKMYDRLHLPARLVPRHM
jgi:hypothetical protein